MQKKKNIKFYLLSFVVFMGLFSVGVCWAEGDDLLQKTTEKNSSFLQDYETVDDLNVGKIDSQSLVKVGVKMLYSLTLVLVLLVVTVFLLKKFFPGTVGLAKDSEMKLVKVVEKTIISPKQEVYLLWAVDRILVVSANNGNMNLLTEIRDKNVIQNHLPRDFSDTLAKENIKFSEIYNV